MASELWKASLTSPVTGPTNPAIVDFSFLSPLNSTPADTAAGIIAYFAALGLAGVLGPNVAIAGLTRRQAGASGSTPVTFPTAEYAALDAANGANLPALTAYGAIGQGTAFEAVGVSVTVSLYTTIPGRKTTGRHYIPWVSSDINDGNGKLVNTAAPQIEAAYASFIQGITTAPYVSGPNLDPCVHSATAGDHVVNVPVCSVNFARLKTRTR